MIKILKLGKPLDYYMTTCRECYTTYLFQDEDIDLSDFGPDGHLENADLICPRCNNKTWSQDEDIYYCDEDGNSKQLVPKSHIYDEE